MGAPSPGESKEGKVRDDAYHQAHLHFTPLVYSIVEGMKGSEAVES